MKTWLPDGAKVLAIYDAASNCLTSAYRYTLKLRKDWLVVFFSLSLHLCSVSFSNAKIYYFSKYTVLCAYYF